MVRKVFQITPIEALDCYPFYKSLFLFRDLSTLERHLLVPLVDQDDVQTEAHAEVLHRNLLVLRKLVESHLNEVVDSWLSSHLVSTEQHLESIVAGDLFP